jgi:hypothetical protein
MESLIVTKGVKPDDLVIGDMNAIMVAARILAYGKEYPTQLLCNSCEHKFEHNIDLAKLDMITPTEKSVNGEYSVTLPTGIQLTYKLLTRGDERAIRNEIDALKKLDSMVEAETTTRLRYMLTSVDGKRDKVTIKQFSENMIIKDLRALRDHIRAVSPDVNFDIDVTCPSCNIVNKVRLPFGANFFWPNR